MTIELSTLFEDVANITSTIVLAGAAVSAIALLISKGSGLRNWWNAREKRRSHIDSLVGRTFVDDSTIKSIANGVKSLEEKALSLEEDVQSLKKSDERHERLLAETLKENQLFSHALLGLLDHAIKNGANGTAHSARKKLQNYINNRAHELKK